MMFVMIGGDSLMMLYQMVVKMMIHLIQFAHLIVNSMVGMK
jgi:hypothetical protein